MPPTKWPVLLKQSDLVRPEVVFDVLFYHMTSVTYFRVYIIFIVHVRLCINVQLPNRFYTK